MSMGNDYRHAKCGAVLAGGNSDVAPDEDCAVCVEVRKLWREHGQLRASAGSLLFVELGGHILQAREVGPVRPEF